MSSIMDRSESEVGPGEDLHASVGPSPLQHVLRGALAIFSTQPVTWAAALVTTVFLPRFLTDAEIGQQSVALTIAGLACTVASLGIGTPLVRRIATRPRDVRADAAAVLVLQAAITVPVALALAIASPLLGFPGDTRLILSIALAGTVATVPQGILFAVLVGRQQHGRFAWINAAVSSVAQLAGIAVLAAGGTLAMYMVIGIAVSAAGTALGWRDMRIGFDRGGIRLERMVRLAREGLPFLGWVLANRLRGDTEIMLLATLLGQQVVGWWAAASRIVSVPFFIPTLICTPLLPALSECTNDRAAFDRTLRRSLVLVMMLMAPACAGIVAVAPALPDALGWEAGFRNSVPLMQALGLILALVAVGTVLGTGLVALGDERRWLVVTTVATGVNVAMNFLAIPAFESWFQNGAIGAAVVRVVTELVMIGGAFVLLPDGTVDRATFAEVARIVLAAACLMIVASTSLPLSLPISMVAGGASYVIVLIALRVVRIDDVHRVRAAALEMLATRRLTARA